LPTTFLPDVLGREEHRLDATDQITEPIAPQLSPREKLILQCLVEGDSNKSIAKKFDSADASVKVHVKAILRKLRVHNRTQAAIWGMNNASQWRAGIDTAPPLSTRYRQTRDAHDVDGPTGLVDFSER
jgi:DNA-binding NarL/FixJ family response regulator